MTIREKLKQASLRLAAAGVPDALVDAAWMLGHILSLKAMEVRAQGERSLTKSQEEAFETLLSRRLAREPLQYILGETSFMGMRFLTRPPVLIPRNDTELLCEQALARLNPGDRVLDLCTGSGAIAVSLKALGPHITVDAGDISPDAITLSKENAALHHATVNFLLGDLFSPFEGQRYDMICSNPPYIPAFELPGLQEEVRHEPMLALDGGEDGLRFYLEIIRLAPRFLKPGGHLLLEMGDGQGECLRALAAPSFYNISIYHDLSGLPRCLAAQWKEEHART